MARRILDGPLASAALLVFAVVWCQLCGSRGLFPFDQSVVLDGGWRIANGQVPFVDFVTPHGVTVMGAQAAVFRLFGVGFDRYVGLAAALNAVATAMAMGLVRRLLPGRPGMRLLAGALTAIWFQPLFGTPTPEQTAFLFSLAGLLAVVVGCQRPRGRGRGLFVVAGACAWLAVASKQNAGAFFLAVHAAVLVAFLGPRREALARAAAATSAGFLGGAGAFLLWLVAFSSPAGFWRAYVTLPSGLLTDRLEPLGLFVEPWAGAGRGPARFVLLACLVVAGLRLSRARTRSVEPRERLPRAAAVVVVALVLFQNVFNLTSKNAAENGFAFLGVVVALTLGMLFEGEHRSAPRRSIGKRVAAASLVTLLALRGMDVGWNRKVHDPIAGATFSERLDLPGWRGLRWPRELTFHGAVVPAADVQALLGWLRRDGRDFFAFPDFTWLYAALQRPSPQPLLWFHRGVTYPVRYDATVDAGVVRSLVEHDVEVVVLEQHTCRGPLGERLADFPRMGEYLAREFDEVERFGGFAVLERREPPEPRGAPGASHR